MKMGINVVFVDCTKLKQLEAAITPETKVGERKKNTKLICLMFLNNVIGATGGSGVCGNVLAVARARGGLCGRRLGHSCSGPTTDQSCG